MRNPQRRVVLTLLAGSILALVSSTQVWFVFDSSEAVALSSIPVDGSESRPLVPALALGVMASVGAVVLAGLVMRIIILAIGLVLSLSGVGACLSAISDPIASAMSSLSVLIGVDDVATVRQFVVLEEQTVWVWLTAVGFAIGCVAAVVGIVTSRSWRKPTSRFDRSSAATLAPSVKDGSEQAGEAWERLSRGEDPTR